MDDVERAVAGDAVSACSAGGSLKSFAATHADADSRHKGSFLSACCFWSKRTFFSRTRWHYLIFLCIYSYLIGPIYLNWAPLRELLFRSGAYLWECDPEERDPNSLRYFAAGDGGEGGGRGEGSRSGRGGRPATCTLQRLRVGNLYTVCAAADFGFSFFGGLVVDWLGPKTGSLLGSASMLGGWLLLAVSGESVPVYVPGMVLFGVGIDMAFYGTMSVARLFPGHANTVIAALAGMRGLGLMSPLILNALPLPYTAVMLGYALLGLLPAVLIASVYAPWKPFHGDWLKEKRRRQQREPTLRATSGGSSSSSSLAFDAAAPTNQHVPAESPKVAAQETAADLLRTNGMTEQQPYSQARRKLLHEEEAEESNYLKWQRRRQKGRQQKGIEREPEQEQQPTANLSAGSAKRIARCKSHKSRGFLGPAAEEKQQLLHPEAAKSGEGRGTHLNNIFGDDVEEGWLSDTGVSGKRHSRLLSPHQHLRQELLRKDRTAEQKTEGDQQYQCGRVAEPGGSCEEDQARCSYITSSTGSKGETGTVPPLSISRVQRPGELLDGASSSSVASAMLQQQQQPQRVAAMSTPTQQLAQQVQPEGRALSGMFDGKGEGQQGQAAALCEDSEGSNKDKRILSFIGGSRRTLSTAEDEDSTELWGTGGVPQRVKRLSVDRVEPDNLGASRAERSDTGLGELYPARGGETVAAASAAGAAATSDMRGNSLPEAGWNVELATMLSPTDESTARAPAESGTQDQSNKAHAAVVLGDKQIPLHRSLSSRQFPRTCAGRMRYLLAYVWQHPWTVQSRAFLRDYLFTLTYLPVVPYFALSLMRSVYFSDASEDLVPAALGTLHVLLAFVCFIPSLAGLLADMWTMMPCLVLVNTIGTLVILGSLCAHLTNIVAFEYVAVILYMPFAALLTNQVYFYVADTFPEKHLGKLCGFACSIGGVVSLSVTPMFEFSVKTEGGFTIMLCVMLAISGVCYGLLVVLYVAQKREKRRRAEAAAAAAAALDVVATASVEAPPKGASAEANVYASSTAAPQPQQQQPAPAAVL